MSCARFEPWQFPYSNYLTCIESIGLTYNVFVMAIYWTEIRTHGTSNRKENENEVCARLLRLLAEASLYKPASSLEQL